MTRRRTGCWRRIAFITAVAVSPGLVFAATAWAGPHEDPYDPKSCKTDAHGKLYIALGRNVLALPTTAGIVVMEAQLYPGDNRIPPPDPTQPDGCPDNPRQLSGYAFPLASSLALAPDEKTSPNQTLGPQFLELFRTLDGDALPSNNDPIWPGEIVESALAPRICSHAAIQEDLPKWASCLSRKAAFKRQA
jgi:hypothetical protein